MAVLLLRLAELMKNPVDGFSVGLADDNNIYEWHCMMEGPPDSDYEGTLSHTDTGSVPAF